MWGSFRRRKKEENEEEGVGAFARFPTHGTYENLDLLDKCPRGQQGSMSDNGKHTVGRVCRIPLPLVSPGKHTNTSSRRSATAGEGVLHSTQMNRDGGESKLQSALTCPAVALEMIPLQRPATNVIDAGGNKRHRVWLVEGVGP